MAKKKKLDGKEIAGRLITIFFVLLLIGGAYYLYTLFKPQEINSENMAGTWKVGSDPVTFYTFEMDESNSMTSGRASSYTQRKGTIEKNDEKNYKYELVLNNNNTYELQLQPLNERGHADGDIEVIKVTGLSRAQMYVIIGRNGMTAMVKVGAM